MTYKILVVEDDKDIQELIYEFLKIQDYQVDVASDGAEGMNLFQNNEYNLVILDIMLPKLNGYQVCQIIRSKSQVPILMLTALGEELDHVKGFDLGVDDYVTKPFSFNILIKRVEALLRRAYGQNNLNVLTFNELVADHEGYQVLVNGTPVELTTKEFEILYTLMSNQGKVLTREVLLDKVWGYGFFGNDRVVDAHIKNLRKKLGVDYIKTIKGVGYKFDE